MNFEEVLPIIRKGGKVRLASFASNIGPLFPEHIRLKGEEMVVHLFDIDGSQVDKPVRLSWRDISASDWEIVQ